MHTYRISNASLCISCVRDTAAKSGFLATISHKVKFSKDIVLKLEGIISHKHFWMLFLQQHFLFKNRRTHLPWCSFYDLFAVLPESSFLLTNTDAHSASSHQSFSLLWVTLPSIRRFKNELAHKILTLSYQRCQSCISCVRACVCVNSVGCGSG